MKENNRTLNVKNKEKKEESKQDITFEDESDLEESAVDANDPGSEIDDYAIEMSRNPTIGWHKHLLYKHISNKYVLPKNLTAEKLVRFAQARKRKLDQANRNNLINNYQDLEANPKNAVEITKFVGENINTNYEKPVIEKNVTSISGDKYKKSMEDSKDLNAESKYMFK